MVKSQKLGTQVGHVSIEPSWITSQQAEHNGAVSPSEDLVRGQLEDIPNDVEKFSK